jgi:hypothetical protein
MGSSAVDFIAVGTGAAVALLIVVALVLALREDNARRGWIVAGALFVVLSAAGIADLLRHSPRETPISNVLIGVLVPVLGTLGILRATRRVRPWIRWSVAYLTAFLLVFAGFLLGATLARFLPF